MSQAPPEIEALIWSIAETGDAQAVAEFEARFPNYRLELLKRVNAVQELRKAKGDIPARPALFVPTPKPPAWARFGKAGVASVALVGVAFASFWGSGRLFGAQAPSMGQGQQPSTRVAEVRTAGAQGANPTKGAMRETMNQDGDVKTTLPTNPTPIPPTRLPTPDEKPLTIHVERANLLTLLDGLAQQVGWQMEIAPGTPDPEVRVDYDQVPAVQILQDMGKRFGFTAFDEGNHKILIVPARDGTGPTKLDPKSDVGSTADPKDPIGSFDPIR